MANTKEYDKKILDRITMFSDAVYGIVLTLLVLELHLPELVNKKSSSEMIENLQHILPKLIAFLLSAKLIGGIWIGTSRIQANIVKSSKAYIIYSVVFIVIISLLPFCCSTIGNYYENPFSYVLFGVLMIALALNGWLCINTIIKNKLLDPSVETSRIISINRKLPFLILYLALTAASAYLTIWLSFALFVIYILTPGLVILSFKVNKEK